MTLLFTLFAISCSGDSTKDTTDSNQDDIISIQAPDDSIVVFAASDVEQATIDNTVLWLEKAQDLWYTEDTFGWEHDLYSPIYLVLVGDDMQATIDLEEQYCDHLHENHPVSVEYSRCTYIDPNCENGSCLFTDLALPDF